MKDAPDLAELFEQAPNRRCDPSNTQRSRDFTAETAAARQYAEVECRRCLGQVGCLLYARDTLRKFGSTSLIGTVGGYNTKKLGKLSDAEWEARTAEASARVQPLLDARDIPDATPEPLPSLHSDPAEVSQVTFTEAELTGAPPERILDDPVQYEAWLLQRNRRDTQQPLDLTISA